MFKRMLRNLTRSAHRPVKILPVVACVPGVDVWFLRFTFAFLAHLRQGGHVVDRLSGQCVGNPACPSFDFDHVSGGPLLWAPDLVPSHHLFIGHTVCPGFDRISSQFEWWASTPFSMPGHDYLHDGINYAHVPVDLGPHAFVSVSVGDVEAAAWAAGQRMVLVYNDPIEYAVGCFTNSRNPVRPVHGQRPVTDRTFQEYLLKRALPSYAKMFISYQAMAQAVPDAVDIVAEDALRAEPARILSSLLSHLRLDRWQSAPIDAVANLSRREHIMAIERDLERSLTGSRRSRRKSAVSAHEAVARAARDPDLRREALSFLASRGVNTAYFKAAPAAASFRGDAAAAGGV
jgi:hypothetical protein